MTRTSAMQTAMSRMFAALDQLPVPMVGRARAPRSAGAGLAAVCDIVVADEQALFDSPR
jgi:enoyl-CoA hydratase/carnithine racemase